MNGIKRMNGIKQMEETVCEELTVRSERGTEIPVGVIIPEHRKGKGVPLVIVCHGYLGNKDENGLFYGGVHDGSCPGITEQLAQAGIATVRMTYPGCGESKESLESYNIKNMISDTKRAYEYVLENYEINTGQIGLLGWSNGGRVAALFSEIHTEIKAMVLWAPVAANGGAMWPGIMKASGQDYHKLLNESEMTGRAKVIWQDGEKEDYLGIDFFKQNNKAKPLDALKKYTGRMLIIIPDQDEVVAPWVYEEITRNTSAEIMRITGADHSFGVDTNMPGLTKASLCATISYFYRKLEVSAQL